MKNPKLIALDCDHVMLDYTKHWGTLYQKLFNQNLTVANPKAFYAKDYWGVDWSDRKQEEERFRG